MELRGVDLSMTDLSRADLNRADLTTAHLNIANLAEANLTEANLRYASLTEADLSRANLSGADLREANLGGAYLRNANLGKTILLWTKLTNVYLHGSSFSGAILGKTIFANSDLSNILGLKDCVHSGPSHLATDIFVVSNGNIPEAFLEGCGLSDWEIEFAKLYDPDLSNDKLIDIQNRIFDLRQRQAIQINPLFISYNHADSEFVNKMEDRLNEKGVRFWRDVHGMKSGRIEKQIDMAVRQNPTVLLVISNHSLNSDWVEHEVRTARALEKEIVRDVLCPVALDASWKDSRWPKRIIEQIMEYNILDFSEWQDDSKFDGMFRKLIDGLELFYKG